MIIVGKFSRFAATGLLANVSVLGTIEFSNSRWVSIFGRPIRLIMDKGPGLVGEQWESYTAVRNITWISNPTEAPFQGGLFERRIGVLKYASAAVKRADPACTWDEAVTAACVGRNLPPMLESGYSPSAILLGRKDTLAHVLDHEFLPEGKEDDDPYLHMHEAGIKRILQARASVVEFESKEIVRKCLAKQLRAYADQYFEKDQNVQVMADGRWLGGFRFVGALRHNGLVEKGPTVSKVPLSYIRPSPSVLIQLEDESLGSTEGKTMPSRPQPDQHSKSSGSSHEVIDSAQSIDSPCPLRTESKVIRAKPAGTECKMVDDNPGKGEAHPTERKGKLRAYRPHMMYWARYGTRKPRGEAARRRLILQKNMTQVY